MLLVAVVRRNITTPSKSGGNIRSKVVVWLFDPLVHESAQILSPLQSFLNAQATFFLSY